MHSFSHKESERRRQDRVSAPGEPARSRPRSGARSVQRSPLYLNNRPAFGLAGKGATEGDYFRPLRSAGEPLAAATRGRMEERLGHPLAAVRVHADAEAARSAESLGAAAYTVGRDVVLGRGAAAGGDDLLAHELGHAVRQGLRQSPHAAQLPWTKPGDASEREAASGRAPAFMSEPLAVAGTWTGDALAIWKRFDTARNLSKTAEAVAAAEELLAAQGQQEGWVEHGAELSLWLLDNGRADLAERALRATEFGWVFNASLEKGGKIPLPSFGSVTSGDTPSALIARAKTAARADEHTLAFRLFGLAFEFLQMQLIAYTERRGQELEQNPPETTPESFFRSITYHNVRGVYDRMREILSFYDDIAREARDAGNDQLAGARSGLGLMLATELEEDYAWSGEAMTGEFTRVDTARGPALRIHGANLADTDVTQLPGLPSPSEVKGNIHWSSLENVRASVRRQAELLGELRDDPEVRKEFGTADIDMNDPAQRMRVWAAMLRSYEARGGMFTSPLYNLIMLIGRYLKAFTRHSEFNVRDFGTSYLDSTLPTDLASRAVRDCGVYALTTAWEVFKTARGAKVKRKVTFELVFSPDHVVLVIKNVTDDETFVVSNDQILPASGDPSQTIAKQFATQPGRGTAAFGRRLPVGSTDASERSFKKGIWDSYTKGGVTFKPLPKSGPDDTRTEAERFEAAAARYYEVQKLYDEGQEAMRAFLNGLDAERASGDEAKVLAARLPLLTAAGRELALLFIEISMFRQGIPGGVTIWHAVGQPPLVRTALLLLRHAELGGTLTTEDVELIRFAAAAFGSAEISNHHVSSVIK